MHEILAGPYKLTHKLIKNDSITIKIFSNNMLESKKYQGKKLISEKKEKCADFDEAI
jgi:hypothetical protein